MSTNSVKIGNKAFSDRKETNFIAKDSGLKNISAADEQKLNGQAVGDVLNKIADPNWVDPSKKIRAVGDQSMDKNAFMKLMLTQMKNQDPTNPIQAHEMAAQLASFTSVEQLQNLNTTMQEMKKEQSPIVNFEALNFIGKLASGDSSELLRLKDDKTHEVKFNLPKDVDTASLKIRNSQGETVRVLELKDLKAGANSVTWNGQDDKGVDTAPDKYQIFIEAKDKQNHKVIAETKFDGTITGVNFSAQGPILMIGNKSIPLADVKKIMDPKITIPDLQNISKESENKVSTPASASVSNPVGAAVVGAPAVSAQAVSASVPVVGAPKAKLNPMEQMKKLAEEAASKEQKDNKATTSKEQVGSGNLQNVPMARAMAEKVEKEAGKEVTI